MKRIFLGLVVLAFSSAAHGNWEYFEQADVMTDEVTSYARYFGSSGEYILIFCREENSRYGSPCEIFVAFDSYISLGDSVVVYRFDSEPPSDAKRWVYSDQTPGGLWVPPPLAEQFVEKLKTASRLAVRASWPKNTSITAIFEIAGAAEAINKLSCLQN